MNDFTKKELIKILSWADVYTEFGTSWVTKAQMPLIDKIQSLIDNYCEHELYYDYDDCADYCKKCDKKIAVDRRRK